MSLVPSPPAFRRRHPRLLLRGAAVTALLAAGAVALSVPPAAAAPTAPAQHRSAVSLTAAAKAAGVQPGNAPMGWHNQQVAGSATSSARGKGQVGASVIAPSTGVQGMDVASYQGTVKWKTHVAAGRTFAFVKATESLSYTNPFFNSQYGGSYKAGMVRGAYHFAIPSRSTGPAQARYFVANGGGWTGDGQTLPGVLDIEYNPYGPMCYGKTPKQMVTWIKWFNKQYKWKTGRDVIIYTNYFWWVKCTGNSTAFNQSNPLWIARYSSDVGTLPGQWSFYTFWQYTDRPYDKDLFSASRRQLRRLAIG